MSRGLQIGSVAGAALLVVFLGVLVVASPVRATAPELLEPDEAAAFRLKLDYVVSAMETGDWDLAFRRSARLRKDNSLVTILSRIADGRRRNPDPRFWNFPQLLSDWEEVRHHESTRPALKRLAEERLATNRRERGAAVQMLRLNQGGADAMRARNRILNGYEHTLIAVLAASELDRISEIYADNLKRDVARAFGESEPDWESILARLREGETLLGRKYEDDIRRASRGLRDRTQLEQALDHFDGGKYNAAVTALDRIGSGSPYADIVREARINIRLHVRRDECVRLFLTGNGTRSASLLNKLLIDWPRELRGRRKVEELALEAGRIHDRFEDARRTQARGEHDRALREFQSLLDNRIVDGFYRRESEKRIRQCRTALAREQEQLFRRFTRSLELGDWIQAKDTWLALGTETRKAAVAALEPRANAIVRAIEKNCWASTIGVGDRAAAELLESALPPIERLEKLREDYAKHFERTGK